MSDSELERLRKQRLTRLRKRLLAKTQEKEEDVKERPYDVLNRIFVGRAWEVFQAVQAQYPVVAKKLEDILIQLASSGRIRQVSGEDLFFLLRKSGVRVQLKTTIRIKEHGELKSLEEKMRE
jgi:DNA-binding TFAR19-related protein (PDSD5 family)